MLEQDPLKACLGSFVTCSHVLALGEGLSCRRLALHLSLGGKFSVDSEKGLVA